MGFQKDIGLLEISLISLFFIFYILYLFRLYHINPIIKVDLKSVFFKFILRISFFTLLILSLLGPDIGIKEEKVDVIGKEIMIAVDLSESMNANDIQPSRIEKVKFEIKKIIDEFSGDRIGIIMFSGEAFVQCPLTYDKNALNLFVETLNTELVPNSGTDFGPPLELGLTKLKDEKSGDNNLKSKMIILFSDGEDFGEETNKSIEKIKENSLKLFSVGIGTSEGSKIFDNNGNYKKDKEGKIVVSKLNSTSLKETAMKTGGKYYEISKNVNEINQMISDIKNIKGDMVDQQISNISENKYFYFLLSALFLVIIDFIFVSKIISL
ncbi:MAG: VWA domain-containing protein [Flammeovirgaceae bacterium TMED290]|nr:MAG: VWA domain-containing protein [Flammeovirgaceae bacterium TMED290]|tara:strand:- start:13557 stop:14528 length:972 start_codon:yes stop_codon:yes gene_type:complete